MDKNIKLKLDNFFTKYSKKVLNKNNILIEPGTTPEGIYYLKEGIVKEYTYSKKGAELVVNIYNPLSFFPMSWAINEITNIYYFQSLTPVVVYVSPKVDVINFIKMNPDVLYNLLSRVYIGTDGLLMKTTYLMAGNVYDRFITELIISAKRFGKYDDSGKIIINLTERDLSNHTGISRETVSRIIKQLKEKKLIKSANRALIITNLNLLEEELNRIN